LMREVFCSQPLLADELGLGSLMIRKSGKLPGEVISKSYELEYGTNELSMQKLPDLQNKRVVVVDDLLATGGTIKCANDLIESQGAKVVGCAFVVELLFLKGSHLIDCETLSLQKYE